MRLIIVIALIVGSALLVAFLASGDPAQRAGPRRVAASFYPLAYAAEHLGGERGIVDDLTPPGAEPHDLEVSPSVVDKIHSASLVVLLGHGFQPQLERAADGSNAGVLSVLDMPGLRRFRNGDPHVWLDPVRYALVVRRLGRVLGADAGGLIARLRSLDRAYRTGLAHCERREIVTSHEAFAYLAARYRLRQIPISGLSPEAEPTPAEVARSVETIRRTHATTVYREPLVSPKIAETVASEAGAATAVLSPIEALTRPELGRGEDYFSIMRANLAALRKGLGCR